MVNYYVFSTGASFHIWNVIPDVDSVKCWDVVFDGFRNKSGEAVPYLPECVKYVPHLVTHLIRPRLPPTRVVMDEPVAVDIPELADMVI